MGLVVGQGPVEVVAQQSDTGAHTRERTPLLRLVGITKRFGPLVANNDVNLTIRGGEIHGLLGENGAGKSTLMNIVYGLLSPDEGHIEFRGEPVTIKSPQDALRLGIGMVHQHFMLVPDMTVAENVALGIGRRLRRSHLREVAERVRELSAGYGLALDPDDVIHDVAVGVRQRVEIVKLLYRGADLLIMDEPTAALTGPEWDDLAVVLRSLVASGKSVVFITHKLDELFGVAKRCSVLRDGCVIGESLLAGASKGELARQMVGREVSLRVEHTRRTPGAPVLQVQGLSLVDASGQQRLSDVGFEVREREILGIAGVDGNGQRELEEILSGMREPSAGTMTINGQSFSKLSPPQFRAAGGAVVPEDRHRTGTVLSMSVADNLVLKDFGGAPFSRRGVIDHGAVLDHAQRLAAEYDIRAQNLTSPISALSGGNQQKAVLARELYRHPSVLIAAQPTRGLDVGAIENVYRRLLEYRDRGGAILLLSTELDEVLTLADRLAVIVEGRFMRTLDVREASAERLGLLMAGEDAPDPEPGKAER